MLKKLFVPAAAALLAVCGLTGCGKYPSGYYAVGFVHSNSSDSADMSFYSFDGTISYKLSPEGRAGRLTCSGSLEQGDLTVYYDCGKGKTRWAELSSGGEVSLSEAIPETDELYIIVETNGKCSNGELSFKEDAE